MKRWMHKLEHFVDKAIPYLLVALIFIIFGEIFYHDALQPYHIWVEIADYIIIGFFVVDLIFKYIRVKDLGKFVKTYWLEIIAVMPVFMVLRLIEEFVAIAELGQSGQKYLHSAVEIQKETRLIATEAERVAAQSARSRYFARFVRPLARMPRFFMASIFYDKPPKVA